MLVLFPGKHRNPVSHTYGQHGGYSPPVISAVLGQCSILLVPEPVNDIGIYQLIAGPAVEDGGSVAVLGNQNIVIARGLDAEYIHLGIHLAAVGVNEFCHIHIISAAAIACLQVLAHTLPAADFHMAVANLEIPHVHLWRSAVIRIPKRIDDFTRDKYFM